MPTHLREFIQGREKQLNVILMQFGQHWGRGRRCGRGGRRQRS